MTWRAAKPVNYKKNDKSKKEACTKLGDVRTNVTPPQKQNEALVSEPGLLHVSCPLVGDRATFCFIWWDKCSLIFPDFQSKADQIIDQKSSDHWPGMSEISCVMETPTSWNLLCFTKVFQRTCLLLETGWHSFPKVCCHFAESVGRQFGRRVRSGVLQTSDVHLFLETCGFKNRRININWLLLYWLRSRSSKR